MHLKFSCMVWPNHCRIVSQLNKSLSELKRQVYVKPNVVWPQRVSPTNKKVKSQKTLHFFTGIYPTLFLLFTYGPLQNLNTLCHLTESFLMLHFSQRKKNQWRIGKKRLRLPTNKCRSRKRDFFTRLFGK